MGKKKTEPGKRSLEHCGGTGREEGGGGSCKFGQNGWTALRWQGQ